MGGALYKSYTYFKHGIVGVGGGVLLVFFAGKGVDFNSVARFSSMNSAGGNVLLHYPKVGPVWL